MSQAGRSDEQCAALLRAIAEPTRMSIVRVLFDEERSVGDLCEELGLAQHFASRHLAVLRNAGVVTARREAQRMLYRVSPEMRRRRGQDGVIDFGCCRLELKRKESESRV
jgi:ArsR family transcriptional regulator